MLQWKHLLVAFVIGLFCISNPASARFVSNDPVGAVAHIQQGNIHGFNRYAYANNNPYRYVDPDGRVTTDAQQLRNNGINSAGIATFHQAQGNVLGEVSGFNDASTAVSNVMNGDFKGAAVSVMMAVAKPVKAIAKISKVVNSNMPHAVERAVERGVFPDAKTAQDGLKQLGNDIKQNGLPAGTIPDTANVDRILVPVGDKGMAVYQANKKGTAKLKTTLIKKED